MDQPYTLTFALLVLLNGVLILHGRAERKEASAETHALPSGEDLVAGARFKRVYLSVYALAVAADWLQGPYMYTVYKDEKGITESVVAALFTTGFVTAGITATFVGSLADRYGRRNACLGFCVAYTLSCVSVLSEDLAVLFAGRALGGLSTTLLYSVFETWMVAEHHKRELHASPSLSSMFSLSTALSSVIAIGAGIAGETLVRFTGTKTSPFLAAAACLVATALVIQSTWTENHGVPEPEKEGNPSTISAARPSLRQILSNKRILALISVTTLFEGSMYLFVFLWSPALTYARDPAAGPPPYGLIFAAFMAAMSFGSQMTGLVENRRASADGKAPPPANPTTTLLTLLPLAAIALLLPALAADSEPTLFAAFVLFELCVGLYFPTMAKLKSDLVADEVRGLVYTVMRVPLNVLVVGVLGGLQEGADWRGWVWTATGGGLLAAGSVVGWGLR